MSQRSRRLPLVAPGVNGRYIDLVPGPADYRAGTYLWVGDYSTHFGYTKANRRQLSAFAHAILRAIGEEEGR